VFARHERFASGFVVEGRRKRTTTVDRATGQQLAEIVREPTPGWAF
jgi:hypothetical protein